MTIELARVARPLRLAAVLLVLATGLSAPDAARALSDETATTVPADEAEETARPRHGERDHNDGKVGIGSDVVVKPDETVNGDVVCIGGRATIEGTVLGNVVMVAGRLDLTGDVDGDVVGVMSRLDLKEGAEVTGQIVNVGGKLDRRGAEVGGQVVNLPGPGFPSGWLLPAILAGPVGLAFWGPFLELVLVFIGLVLLTAVVPDRVRALSREAPVRFLPAFFVGILGYLAFFVGLVLVCITCIGIPLLFLVFVAFQWLGLAGIFHAVGQRLGRLLGRELSTLGAVLLGFLPFAILYFLPFCIGWIIWRVLKFLAVGLVILTRAGGRTTPLTAAPLSPPAPPT